jgi:hypothetical protein
MPKGLLRFAVRGEHRLRSVPQDEVLVRDRLFDLSERRRVDTGIARIEHVDDAARYLGNQTLAAVERVGLADLVCRVVLRGQPERAGLHPQVGVFGDQHDFAVCFQMAQRERRVQNAVIGVVSHEGATDAIGVDAQDDSNASRRVAQRDAVFGDHVAGELIQFPQKLAGLSVNVAAALLEPVQLFEHGDGDRDVVLVEIEDAGRVVQDDVRIENEQLDLSGRRR